MARKPFRSMMLKLSGEALAGPEGNGLSPEVISSIAQQIRELTDLGVEVSVLGAPLAMCRIGTSFLLNPRPFAVVILGQGHICGVWVVCGLG